MAKEININNYNKIDENEITTVLAEDININGTLKFNTSLMIKGKFEGDIDSDGILIIGKNAEVKATIKTKILISHGSVEGNITAMENVIFTSTAAHTGDVTTPDILIESGSTFNGKCKMDKKGETLLIQDNTEQNQQSDNQSEEEKNKKSEKTGKKE